MKKKILFLAAMAIFFTSCSLFDGDDDTPGTYDNGAFVVNEGSYGSSNASASFIPSDGSEVVNDVFTLVNQRPLGDVLQSIAISDNKVYMAVNGSNKVEVAGRSEFNELGTIEGLDNPRYIAFAKGKAYISQWGANGSVAVADISAYTVSKTIDTGTGTEGLIAEGNLIWAANGGGYSLDSTVSVIDPANDEVIKTIKVGYNPKEIVADASGDLWVLCYGNIFYNADWTVAGHAPSKLVKISVSGQSVLKEIPISETEHPQHLGISPDGSTLYFGGGYGFNGIYAVSTSASSIPAAPLVDGYFYGFDINPKNGDIYACEAPNFTNPGKVYIYSSAGTKTSEYTVGIGPSGVAF